MLKLDFIVLYSGNNMIDPRSHVFTYEEILDTFKKEMEGLALIIKSGFLGENLTLFSNFNSMISTNEKKSLKFIKKIFKKTKILEINEYRAEFNNYIYGAHTVMCCALFSGSRFPVQNLTPDKLDALVTQIVDNKKRSTGSLGALEELLQRADSVRVINLLRFMGLLQDKGEKTKLIYQFSMGAGRGTRDMDSMHYVPELVEYKSITSGESFIKMQVIPSLPKEITLNDAGDELAEHYEKLNLQYIPNIKVLALNIYLEDAFAIMKQKVSNGEIQPYNMIVGFRIDHCMLPNVEIFFKSVSVVMAEVADLIITIGAGHSLEEFIGREAKLNEVAEWLEKRGLDVYRIRTAFGKTAEERRKNLTLGVGPISSYEILYCKLKKKLLLK